MNTPLTLGRIAEETGLTCIGDATQIVSRFVYAEDATQGDLAVVRTQRELRTVPARAILTEPRIDPSGRSLLCCMKGELYPALAAVAAVFVAHGLVPDYAKEPAYQEIAPGVFAGGHLHLGMNVVLSPYVTIGDNVTIGDGCRIESGVTIGSGTVLGAGCIVRAGTRIGVASFLHYEVDGQAEVFGGIGRTIMGNDVIIGANTVIQRGTLGATLVEDGACIGDLVLISHDVKIHADAHITGQSGIAGNATIGTRACLMGQAGIVEYVHIGDDAIVYAKSAVARDVPAGGRVSGVYARPHDLTLKAQARIFRNISQERKNDRSGKEGS